MSDCLFCKIAEGGIPARLAWQDDTILAFHDIQPVAPVHVLVIPRKHIPTLDEVTEAEKEIVGHLIVKVPVIAEQLGLTDGYRLVANCKAPAGQSVWHIHFHLMGKRQFSWPPG
jgi:diadenosine tetraphosphate (Ap4A) HIT family hydrolase